MKLKDAECFTLSKDGLPPRIKSAILWASSGGAYYPVCYLRKPKSLSQDDWKLFLDGLLVKVIIKGDGNERE